MPPVINRVVYADANDLQNYGLVGTVTSTITLPTKQAALSACSAVIDSYLASRYQLPLVQWDQDLVRACCVLASYDLLVTRGFGQQPGVDQNIRARAQDTLLWLEQVSKGTQEPASLIDSSTPSADGGDGAVNTTSPDFQIVTSAVRGWTNRGNPGGWGSDSGNGNL